MEELGQGKKYIDTIEQEIAGQFRIMENISEKFKGLDIKTEKADKTFF